MSVENIPFHQPQSIQNEDKIHNSFLPTLIIAFIPPTIWYIRYLLVVEKSGESDYERGLYYCLEKLDVDKQVSFNQHYYSYI